MPKVTLQLAENVPGIGGQGERVTLALTPADVREASEIPEYLAGYNPPGYRADEVSPVVLVDNEEDKFRTFDSDDAYRRVYVKGSTQGPVPEVDPKSSLQSYKVIERYLGSFVPRQTQLAGRASNAAFDPVAAASRRCKRAIMLDREIDAFTLLGSSGNWASGQVTAASGSGWSDLSTGNPIIDIQTMAEKSSQPVSAIWMNQKVAYRFLRHPQVQAYIKSTMGDSGAGAANVAVANAGRAGQNADFNILGLPTIRVVASKVKNESTGALQYVLGDVVLGVTVPPGGIPNDGQEIATTYTFRRRGISGTGLDVREFEVENRGPLGGTMIVVVAADVPVITANNAGGIITGV